MTRHQAAFFRRLVYLYDLIVSVVALLASLGVRAWLYDLSRRGVLGGLIPDDLPQLRTEDYYPLMWNMLPLWLLSLWAARAADFRISYWSAAGRYARAVGIGIVLMVAAQFVFELYFLSRSLVLIFAVVQFSALLLGRVVLMEVSALLRHADVEEGHRVLVVGTGRHAKQFAGSLRTEAPWNHRLVGYVRVPSEKHPNPDAGPILGDITELDEILDQQPVDEVVFAVPKQRPETFEAALRACDTRGVDVLLTLPPDVPRHGQVDLTKITGYELPLIGMRRTPTSEGALLLKRGLDLLGCTIGLLLISPIFIFTALAIKITDPGPIFFSQVRVGRNGRRFNMHKFRSMVVDAEKRKKELMKLNEMDGPVFKIKRDPRITPIGRFIRKTSIDELPQLINVLVGDMSLVGPRPPLPDEVNQYKDWQRRRLSVKPGITGLWQVSGRNQIDFDEWMELDLTYIDNWSIWLDIRILLKTIPVVLFSKGAS